jgi:hypothetical protein
VKAVKHRVVLPLPTHTRLHSPSPPAPQVATSHLFINLDAVLHSMSTPLLAVLPCSYTPPYPPPHPALTPHPMHPPPPPPTPHPHAHPTPHPPSCPTGCCQPWSVHQPGCSAAEAVWSLPGRQQQRVLEQGGLEICGAGGQAGLQGGVCATQCGVWGCGCLCVCGGGSIGELSRSDKHVGMVWRQSYLFLVGCPNPNQVCAACAAAPPHF